MMEEFIAFMHKKGKGSGKGGKGGGKGKAGGKAGGKAEHEGNRKCINCRSTAHLTRDCPKPEVSREDRPCWKCGKPGHVGALCPNSGQPPRAAGMVEQAPEQPLTFFMVGHAEEGPLSENYAPAKHTAKVPSHPVPHEVTLMDFLTPNQYAELAEQGTERRAKRRAKTLHTAVKQSSECFN